MTREELIDHLEHLAEYVKYSEDAPALREVIEMLKCSEMPNGSEERTQKRTETHACDLIQPDHNAEVSKKVGDDLIRRRGVSAWLYNLGYPKLADIVMNEQRFPPAQPDIIRCKDCKHYYYADNRIPQEQRYSCDLDGDRWSPDSYCSFAEKRER